MARGDHQNDDDDFMDPPQHNRATGRRKEGDEVTVHTPLLLLMFLDATSSFAVVCHELKFHDGENMATTDHLSVFCKKRNVLAIGPHRND